MPLEPTSHQVVVGREYLQQLQDYVVKACTERDDALREVKILHDQLEVQERKCSLEHDHLTMEIRSLQSMCNYLLCNDKHSA